MSGNLKQNKPIKIGVTLVGIITVGGTILTFINEANEFKNNSIKTETTSIETTLE